MIARVTRVLPAAVLATLFATLAALAPGAPNVPACAAAGSHHAALVVEHGDGSVVTRCVAFPAGSVTGEQLLNQSGVAWSSQTFGGFGDAVCALDGEPAHYLDCPGKDSYWAVFVARGGGSWQLASVGISTLALRDGDAEGFRYVPASGVPAAPASAAGICPAVATPAPPVTPATPAPRQSVAATGAPGAPAATETAASVATAGDTPAAAATEQARESTPAATAAPGAAGPAAPPSQAPAPSPSGGADTGLLAAATVGGGLAGLAVLRLLARRGASSRRRP